jgi:hypothetical protein
MKQGYSKLNCHPERRHALREAERTPESKANHKTLVIPNRAESQILVIPNRAESQTLVIPNRAESPVRNLLFRQRPELASLIEVPHYRPLQNLPTPTRTCTVFSPGFGTASPAFEICRYRNSTLQLYLGPSTCVPSAAAEVKFTAFV